MEIHFNINRGLIERNGGMMKKWFYEYNDVMRIMNVKEGKAYEIIRKLNEELREKGFLTQRGRVNIKYFNERYNIG